MPDDNFRVYTCSHVGISGVTNVHARKVQDAKIGEEIWEARVGIAIMGRTNDPETGPDSDPFSHRFRDNFARGYGTTEEKALEALRADVNAMADSLWA